MIPTNFGSNPMAQVTRDSAVVSLGFYSQNGRDSQITTMSAEAALEIAEALTEAASAIIDNRIGHLSKSS